MKGLARINTHVNYEIPTTNQSKIMAKVKVFEKKKIKLKGQRYQIKGLASRNKHVKYESSTTHQSKIMTKVKVFVKKVKLQGQRSNGQNHGNK
jgi:hypothetical protein